MSNWADAMHTLYGMPSPEELRHGSVPPSEVVSYCRHCQSDFTARLLPTGAVLCPKCDMPGIAKVGVASLVLRRSDIVTKFFSMAKCFVRHDTKADTVCQKEMGHIGFHTDDRALAQGKKGYSWPKRDTDRQACWEGHPNRAKNAPGSHCLLARGHGGPHFSGADYARWGWGIRSAEDEAPKDITPVERAGKRMITSKLSDGRVVAIEFHHTFDDAAKLLKGTEIRLYRLDELPDDDKPGVTTLVKTLLQSVSVKCHYKDRHKGRAGGRRAALRRLFDTLPNVTRADRQCVWDALWDATASVRTFECGCRAKDTISGKSEFQACDQHAKKDTAA